VGKATTDTLTNKTLGASVVQASNAAPAFSAYLVSNQNITNNSATKLTINTKEYDTATAYDATTNYRFTPLVAGYYQVNGAVAWAAATGVGYISLWKNGSAYKQGNSIPIGSVSNNATVAAQVYLNGSTDFIELYALQNTGGTIAAIGSAAYTYFQAAMIRSA
jgi:hypothetical protein